jgi:cytochrome P450
MSDPYYREQVPSHVPQSLVHDFNIYDPECADLDLFVSIKRLHDIGLPDLFWTRNNGGHWIVLRGKAIAEIMKDPLRFSSKRFLVPEEQNFETDLFVPLMSDPPEHAAYRQAAGAAFSPQRVNAFQEAIRTFTAEFIEQLAPKGQCEFMADFSLQMPIIVVLRLLDLPLEDRLPLLDIAGRIVKPADDDVRDNALQAVLDYLAPILAQRRANPGSDVLSAITQARIGDRAISEQEALGVAAVLLIGGLDTVAGSLGFFTRFLAESPEHRQTLVANPALIRNAAEELTRRYPVTTHGRVVKQDLDFHGIHLKSADHLMWAAAMYNLDERIFPDPLKVDFQRKRDPHMSFGNGPHLCLGATLSRLEFKIFLEEWLKRIPEFRIVPGTELRYRPGINLALHSLPLEWKVP